MLYSGGWDGQLRYVNQDHSPSLHRLERNGMKQQITALVDDIDGSKAVSTIRFSYKGVQYEIDLNTKNAKQFDSDIAKYIEKASRKNQPHRAESGRLEIRTASAPELTAPTNGTNGTKAPVKLGKTPSKRTKIGANGSSSAANKKIRDWASANSINVAPRGMIPLPVRRAYRAAQKVK